MLGLSQTMTLSGAICDAYYFFSRISDINGTLFPYIRLEPFEEDFVKN